MTLIRFTLIGLVSVGLVLFLYAHKNETERRRFLVVFSLAGLILYLYYWATVILIPRDILIVLPLQLCDLAVFLMPIGLMTRNDRLMDFLFYPCGLGASSALILMGAVSTDAFYEMNLNFFFSHFAILVLPYLSVGWGMFDPKPSVKKAFVITGQLLILGALMHGLNLALAHYCQANAFYFFTIIETGVQISPLLALFAKIIPYDYFYLTLTFPILYLYMILVYWVRKQILKRHELKNSP